MDENMEKSTYGLIMGALGAMSCIGHILIALALQRNPELKKKHRFLLTLAAADTMIAAHAFLSTAAAFSPKWPFGNFVCKMDAFIGMTATFVSVSCISWIAKMKYYQKVKPAKYINVRFQSLLEWIFAIVGGLLPFVGFGEYGYETDKLEFRTGCLLTFQNVGLKYWIYIIFIFVFWFAWPFYTIVTYYNKLADASKSDSWLLYVVPMQIVCSLTPYAVYAFASIFYKASMMSGFYVALNNISAKLMIASNPLIYIRADPLLYKEITNIFSGRVEQEVAKEKNQ